VTFLVPGIGYTAVTDPVGPPVPPVRQKPAVRPEASPGTRGQLLYENHCQGCHTSKMHIREQQRAKSLAELRGWVIRWSQVQKLGWREEEISEVVDYLNRRFYKLTVRR